MNNIQINHMEITFASTFSFNVMSNGRGILSEAFSLFQAVPITIHSNENCPEVKWNLTTFLCLRDPYASSTTEALGTLSSPANDGEEKVD